MATLQRVQIGVSLVAYVGATAGSICTNPSAKITLFTGLTLHNTNTTAETVLVHAVPNSAGALGTAATGNRVAKVVLQPDETQFVEFPFGITLTGTNDSIQASTTTASKVTVLVHGDQLA